MPVDTRGMIWEEKQMMDYLRDRRGQPVKTWTMINEVAKELNPLNHRPLRMKLVPLASRLMKEQKIKRHRKSDTVRISEVFA